MPETLTSMPVEGFLGGLLIGLAAAIMLIGSGRIAGVSGIFARMIGISESSMARIDAAAFIVGLPIGAALFATLIGGVVTRFTPSLATIVAGGVAVGFGTRLGGGCTSGHGVCGVSRLSKRSLVAVATFIVTGISTVAAMHVLGMN